MVGFHVVDDKIIQRTAAEDLLQLVKILVEPGALDRVDGGGLLARLVCVMDSDGRSQRSGWDRWGNQVMAADRDGARTVRVFDGRGRLVKKLTEAGVRSSVCFIFYKL